MSWLVSWFSSSRNPNNAKKAMSSAQDAFVLPASSPHPDAFNAESFNMPDSNSSPASYSYPPAGSSYAYVPTSSRSRQSTLLPLHNTPLSPIPPYPPLSQTWERLRTWFAREYPELGDTLNWGILPEDLAQIEMQFGFALPGPVRESYLITDGQEPESSAGCSEGLFFGLVLLPLEDVLEEWRFWRGVDNDPSTGGNARLRDSMQSIPRGWIRREYSLRGWIPLVSDRTGNYIGVDLNPAGSGVAGQVIVFGRDFDTKVVLWKGDGASGWAKWLASFADDLEAGDGFELGVNENNEGSEDDLGYDSYFYDGNGHGSGDGGGSTGGMRLAGEYKGWNTLEALADRSLRKWHEQGYIPDLPVEQEKSKRRTSQMTLATFDLSAAGHGFAAEIPIPVLAEVNEPSAFEPVMTEVPKNISIPTIYVTKPAPPLPVDVPTESDIIHDSPPYRRNAESDAEAGLGMKIQVTKLKSKPNVASSRNPAGSSPLSTLPEYSEDAVLVSMEPRSPESHSPSRPELELLEEVMLEMSPTADERSATAQDDDRDPDTTVEGGSVEGTDGDDFDTQEESDDDLVEVQSVTSTTPDSHENKESSERLDQQ